MNEFFAKEFYYNTVGQWAISLAIIVGTLVAAKIVYWVFGRIMKKLTSKTKTRLDDLMVDMLEEPIVLVITIAGVWFAFNRMSFPDNIQDWINTVYWVIITLTVAWLIARLVDALIKEYIVPLTKKTEGDLDDQIIPIMRKAIRATIWILGIVIALNNAGYNIGALLAGLGIGGLALAMAAKDTVANIFGGITIFTDKPFKINDRVKIGGFDGTITEIGIRSTRLKTLENRIVTIPNSKFTDGMVENVSSEPNRKVVLKLGLTYDTTAEKIQDGMKALQAIVDELDVAYVSALEQYPRYLRLDLRRRDIDIVLVGPVRISDPGQHVSYGIGHHLFIHLVCLKPTALPACLDNAGDLALERQLPEADAADSESPEVRPGTPAPAAPIVRADLELGRPLSFRYQTLLGHEASLDQFFRRGMPRSVISSLASSSVPAVVTIVTSIPMILRILS